MAELTNLESKLGEVLGLAMAAQSATRSHFDGVLQGSPELAGDEDPDAPA
jgi:hypothetical protein